MIVRPYEDHPMVSSTRSARARVAAVVCVVLIMLVCVRSRDAGAHAFISRTEPLSGATVAEAPTAVRIWFDGPVESLYVDLHVEDAIKRRVDRGDGHRSQKDSTLVEVGLTPLRPGRYRVFWSVIARDGHAREG